MVLLTMTAAMVEALQAYNANPPPKTKPLALASEPSLESAAEGVPISHGQIVEISKHLREQAALKKALETKSRVVPSYHLVDLLKGSRVFVPPAKVKSEPVDTDF